MESTVKLSIITAIRDQIEYNRLFFESLRKYTHHPFELIIIDNASNDRSGDFFRDNGATVIRNGQNRCYCCSQNQGLEKARASYVAFLNNDIFLSKDWDRILIDYLERYKLDAISPCGCETLETPGAIRQAMRRWKRTAAMLRLGQRSGRTVSSEKLSGLIRSMYGDWDVFTDHRKKDFYHFLYPGISGFAVVARKSLFEKIGPWNTQITAADFDLRLRMVKIQVKEFAIKQPMIAGDVFVHHFIRTTSRSVKSPYQCTHPIKRLQEVYEPADMDFTRTPAVSVIIAVYNQPVFLRLLLLSLLNQTVRDFEVVISDDGSGPEIASVIDAFKTRFRYPIQHIWHPDNGFQKTIIANKAVMASRSDYLVFVDGDSLLHHKFLSAHLALRKVGRILSGRRVMLDLGITHTLTLDDITSRRFEKPWFWLKHCRRSSIRHGFYMPWFTAIEARVKKNYSTLGSNFSIYKGDYFQINGYDERIIGRGLEDNNLSNRFVAGGKPIINVARQAIQFHQHHTSDPIPHSKETISEFGTPQEAWTPFGIIKKAGHD
jgi:glycosyltransferase involved in cell wall biosynthesis